MGTVPVFCGKDCGGNACPLLAEIESGRVRRIRHNPAAGAYITGCRRGYALAEAHYAPDRLRRPLIRVGRRGSNDFREAGWEEALELVARRLGETRSLHGPESTLCLASSGSTGALHDTVNLARRFLNGAGGGTILTGSYSTGAANSVLPYIFGEDWKDSGFDAATMKYSKTIILWGANLLDTRLGAEMPARIIEARDRGASIIVIDPRKTATVERVATRWIPCRPGTDAALMLAVLYVLSEEGLIDRAFAARRSVGLEELEAQVRGRGTDGARTPQWAEDICGVAADEIVSFAREYASSRPTMLIPGFSIQRVRQGEESMRLAVALQLATGNFGIRGGSTGSLNNLLPVPRVGSIDRLVSPVKSEVPVLLWPDAILRGRAGGFPADIHSAYVCGSNFLGQGADVRMSARAMDALEFSVCHEMFLTPTARHCDVVLPAASALEKEDIGIPWVGNYLLYKPQALRPEGLARSDYDIFSDLAARMGFEEVFSEGRSAGDWIKAFLADSEISDTEEFLSSGFYRGAEQERVGLADFSADPEGRRLLTPSGKVEIASQTYARDTGRPAIPAWDEGVQDPRFPLLLVTPKIVARTHSQGGDDRSRLFSGSAALEMNRADAAARGIEDGSAIRVHNGRGSIHTKVRVSGVVMPGVVSLPEGVWFRPAITGEDQAGCANVLTSTEVTGPARACAMHGVGVEVDLEG
jgi:anaerobic dimethyl sulfoxide reductase subunit A